MPQPGLRAHDIVRFGPWDSARGEVRHDGPRIDYCQGMAATADQGGDVAAPTQALADAFFRDGYVRLGVRFDEPYLHALRVRAEQLMLGQTALEGMFFQHDAASGRYEDLRYRDGYVGPSLSYRKVEGLERDPLFRAHIDHPEIARVVQHMIPGPVVIYRATLFNKAATGGMRLPWHQDGGRFWGVHPAPFLQVWTALDECGEDAGCLHVIPGSHASGLVSPEGGVVPEHTVAPRIAESLALPAAAGEVILVHNHLWHSAPENRSGHPRRTVSVCYMTASTRCLRTRRAPRRFVPVF